MSNATMHVFHPKDPSSLITPYLSAIEKEGLVYTTRLAKDYGMASILTVHDPDYVQFISRLIEKMAERRSGTGGLLGNPWQKAVTEDEFLSVIDGDAFRNVCFPQTRLMRHVLSMEKNVASLTLTVPAVTESKIGYYSFDLSMLRMSREAFQLAYDSAQVALTAANHVFDTELPAVALCPVIGHHADASLAGGGALFNQAALAASFFVESSTNFQVVTVLDLDGNHGNGTQSLFYQQNNPAVISIHCESSFPYWTGKASEKGTGMGHGRNLNIVLPDFSLASRYLAAVDKAIGVIREIDTTFLVISLGLNVLADDEDGLLLLNANDFNSVGKKLAELLDEGIRILIVTEGLTVNKSAPTALVQFLEPFSEYCYYQRYV